MQRIALLFLLVLLVAGLSAQSPGGEAIQLRSNPEPLRPEWAPFYHGVASGDPLADRVVIWTRVTPESSDGSPVPVRWRVATDPELEEVVQSGQTETGPQHDYTVKVDVSGLEPGVTYYYGFTALERHSLTGRTATTPAGGDLRHLRFGLVSCTNFQIGYFNALGALARRSDLDGIIQLGDYIYEQPAGPETDLTRDRPIAPANKLITLEDYRLRYASYRLDTNLVRAHQQHPFLLIWDDHEFADNAYPGGANTHDPATDGDWATRLAAARQAYFEWLPIRGKDPQQSIYRSLRYGDLMELFLLDTRLEGRDAQLYDAFDPGLLNEDRTILGQRQKAWLLDRLGRSPARWKIIGQQVPFSPLELGWAASIDQDSNTIYAEIQGETQDAWNGYPAERQQLLDFFRANDLENIVILSGSYHVSMAFDVTDRPVNIEFRDLPPGLTPFYTPSDRYDPQSGAGSLAVEFVAPSITSNNFDENFPPTLAFLLQQLINRPVGIPGGGSLGNPNPHLKYPDLTSHGYCLLDVKPDSVQANWYFHDILRPSDEERFGQAWYTRYGDNRLRRAAADSPAKPAAAAPAPPEPPAFQPTSLGDTAPDAVFAWLRLQPNPFHETTTMTYSLRRASRVRIELYDAGGRLLRRLADEHRPSGLHTLQIYADSNLPEGIFFVRAHAGGRLYSAKVVHVR